MSKIKLCECGGKATVKKLVYWDEGFTKYYIECFKCGISLFSHRSIAKAIKEWNTRLKLK